MPSADAAGFLPRWPTSGALPGHQEQHTRPQTARVILDPLRMLFLLDEVARLGYMGILETARDTGRKYSINLCLPHQSLGQLTQSCGHKARQALFDSAYLRLFSRRPVLRDSRLSIEGLRRVYCAGRFGSEGSGSSSGWEHELDPSFEQPAAAGPISKPRDTEEPTLRRTDCAGPTRSAFTCKRAIHFEAHPCRHLLRERLNRYDQFPANSTREAQRAFVFSCPDSFNTDISVDTLMNATLPPLTTHKSQSLQILSAFLIYLFLSLYFFGAPLLPNLSTSYLGRGADPSIFIWDLVWWPYALANRLNPFISRVVWAPTGYNLAWATSLPGPSLIMAPLTWLFGPVVSYNILCILSPHLAACSNFLLCRYLCKSFWIALLAGYIFGFSSYMLGQMRGHLFLVLIFPIPLAVYLTLLRLDQILTSRSFVIMLVPFLALQFLTSTEIFATMTLFATLILFLSYSLAPRVNRHMISTLARLIVFSYGIVVILMAPYLYYALAYGEPGPINQAAAYSTDLLNFLLPTRISLFGERLVAITDRFRGNLSENGAYLGPGLLMTLALFGRQHLWNFSGQLLLLSLGLVCLTSLGPILHIAGTPTIPLPWLLAAKAPLFDQALPCRFSLFVFLIGAVMITVYLSGNHINAMLKVLIAVICIVFLLPSGRPPVSQTGIPLFFRLGTYRYYLAKDDVVLVLPYGVKSRSLLWQAYTHMYFRLAVARLGVIPPEFATLPILNEFQTGIILPHFADELKAFLSVHPVSAIIVDTSSPGSWPELLASIGLKATRADDVILYTMRPRLTPVEGSTK